MVVGYRPRHVVRGAAMPPATWASACAAYSAPLDQLRVSIESQYVERIHALEEQSPLAPLLSSADVAATRARTGRERLARLNEALNSFGVTRSKGQRDFHRNMTMAIIHKLFKDDFAENVEYLREQFHTDVFKPEVLIITPRRFGKTWSVAMFVAAAAYALEDSDQAIFSTGRRASKKLLDLIHQFLCKLPGMEESIRVKNVETIHIRFEGETTWRKISSYPSKVRSDESERDDAPLLLLLL